MTPARSTDRSEERIRTFHGRHGRVTPRMQAVLDRSGPLHGLSARADPTRPLVLEVGCGAGDAALAFAAAHHEVDLLAVDVHTPGIVRLLEERDRGRVPNLYVERADGVDVLDHRVDTGALAGVHLFFPDPWPKARHRKRRFVRADLLDLVADRLAPGAPFRLATDVADYAESATELLAAHPAFEPGPTTRPPWRPQTRYERAGLDAGRTVVDRCWYRSD